MTQAIWNGTVIADSEVTSVIKENHSFRADSVRWELPKETGRRDAATSTPGLLRRLRSGGQSR